MAGVFGGRTTTVRTDNGVTGRKTGGSGARPGGGNNTLDFMGDRLVGAGGYSTLPGGGGSNSGGVRNLGVIGTSVGGTPWQPQLQGQGGGISGALGNPGSLASNVQQNPQIAALQGRMQSYTGGLAAGNDQDAQYALMRQRDIASGMAKEGLQGALDRGFSGDSGYAQQRRLQGLDAGQAATAGLNAQLAADARKQQLSALQSEGNLAIGQAGISQGQQSFLLNQWQAQQSALQSQAQMAEMQRQNNFNRAMTVYTGF